MTNTPEPANVHQNALHSIPGYATAEERIARLSEWDGSRARTVTTALNDAAQALRDGITAVADGGDVDLVALARRTKELEAERDIEALITGYATGISASLRSETRSLTPAEKDHALRYLNGLVQQVATEVRTLDATLGAVSSSSAAFRGTPDQLTAWQRLDQLVELYEAVRTSQHKLVLLDNGGPITLGKLHTTGLLADAFDRDRFWISRRMQLVRQASPFPDSDQPYERWLAPDTLDQQAPIERTDNTWWPTPDRHEYLRWASVNARPWVPTMGQLDAAHDAANTALQSTGLPHVHKYFAITGATPITPLPAVNETTAAKQKRSTFGTRQPARQFGS